MKSNNKVFFTLAVVLSLMAQQFSPVLSKSQSQQSGVLGGLLGGGGSLINLDLNLCLFKAVGQFKTFCAEDYLNIVDLKAYLNVNFDQCFPDGIIIGNLLGLHVKLTVLDAVNVFLNLGGPAGLLSLTVTNPTNCTGGILAREILVLTINLALDAFNPYWCVSPVPLAQLVLKEGPCAGLSVGQILVLANSIISGGPCPDGLTLDVLVDVLVKINLNFRAALVNNLYLAIPKLLAVNLNLAC
jgi:DNA-binding MltR family transcriptional regulator